MNSLVRPTGRFVFLLGFLSGVVTHVGCGGEEYIGYVTLDSGLGTENPTEGIESSDLDSASENDSDTQLEIDTETTADSESETETCSGLPVDQELSSSVGNYTIVDPGGMSDFKRFCVPDETPETICSWIPPASGVYRFEACISASKTFYMTVLNGFCDTGKNCVFSTGGCATAVQTCTPSQPVTVIFEGNFTADEIVLSISNAP